VDVDEARSRSVATLQRGTERKKKQKLNVIRKEKN
jgi:hypothetical protein